MSLAAALKKGQAAIDTLGSWDPFPEGQAEGPGAAQAAAPARLAAPRSAAARPAGKSAPANVNAADKPVAHAPERLRPLESTPRTAARAVLAGRAPGRAAAAEAPRRGGKAAWLQEGVPAQGRVNAAQYIRELERFAAEESRRAVADTVMDVNSSEIEGVAKLAARVKGRYLAKLLDLGNPSKSTVQETEVRELTRYRETYEELARGLDMLKAAIEAGDVGVSGMVRR